MQVAIEPVRSTDDLAEVAGLFREYVDWLGLDLTFQGFEAELAGLPGKYAAPAGELFRARLAEGSPVGCVGVRPLEASGVCEMKRLFVRPAARGTGTGRALVEAAVLWAVAAGYAEMVLDTLPSMVGAIGIYRALGFTPVEPYYNNPVPGALFFRKTFAP